MRIGIDTRELAIARTGTRTYLEEILTALQSSHHEIITLHPERLVVREKRTVVMKIAEFLAFTYWKQIQLPRLTQKHRCDLLFCTDFTIPLISSVPAIPVFYGANFWANPQQYNKLWRTSLDLLTVPAAKRAPAVVTISEFSRKDIIAHTGISPEKIFAIPIAPKTKATVTISETKVRAALLQHHIDPSIPFLLHVGVMEKRKNLVNLIEAFALFQQQVKKPHQLVLVGQRGPHVDMDDSDNIIETVTRLGLTKSVQMVGHVSDESLPAFYQAAVMFVFPATREGFGIPVLEAFSQGVPVAAANRSAIPEVAGDAALLFDPTNPQEIAEAMLKLAENESLRQELIAKGNERRTHFGWDKTAQQLIALFERVLAK